MRRIGFLISALVFTCLFLANAQAAQMGFMGIGGRLGYIKPEDPIESTFGFGVVADLGTIVPALRLEGSLDYWSKSYKAGYFGFADAEWKYSDLMIGATAKYMIPTQGKVSPFAGGGLALHMFSYEYEYEYINPFDPSDISHEKYDDSETDIGFHAVGGAEMRLSPNLRGSGEFRYAIADPDHFGIFFLLTYLLKP